LLQILDSVIQAWTPYGLCLHGRKIGGQESAKMNCCPLKGRGRSVTEMFEFISMVQTALVDLGPPHYRGFKITLRHTTIGRTPLDEWSTQRWDLDLIRHNTHKRQTSIPLVGFEPTIPASEQLHTHALDRAAHESPLALNYLFKDSTSIFTTFLEYLRFASNVCLYFPWIVFDQSLV
jgi:hypothetical protein